MRVIPLTNTFGERIGQIEIEDRLVEDMIEAMPQLWLGYRVRGGDIEKFILQRIEG
jgi:hypothetical protein